MDKNLLLLQINQFTFQQLKFIKIVIQNDMSVMLRLNALLAIFIHPLLQKIIFINLAHLNLPHLKMLIKHIEPLKKLVQMEKVFHIAFLNYLNHTCLTLFIFFVQQFLESVHNLKYLNYRIFLLSLNLILQMPHHSKELDLFQSH